MYLAWKEIRYSKRRYALVISVVILIAYLVFFLLSLAYGLAASNRSAIDAWNADGVLMSDAANGTIGMSDLDRELLDDVEAGEKAPLNVALTVMYRNGEREEDAKISVAAMGVDQDSFLFPELVEGEAPSAEDEVVISERMHTLHQVDVGDTLEHAQSGRTYTVTGMTHDYEYIVSPTIYGDVQEFSTAMMAYRSEENEDDGETADDTADDAANDADTASDGTEAEAGGNETGGNGADAETDAASGATTSPPERMAAIVVRDLQSVNNDILVHHEMDDFIDSLPGYKEQVLTFGLMIGFLVVISAVVIGIFMYILTVQKQTVFGVMKVQGIRSAYISKAVLWQTLIIAAIGVLAGIALTLISALFLPLTVPFKIHVPFFAALSGFMILVALLGTFFSTRAVSAIDPLDAID